MKINIYLINHELSIIYHINLLLFTDYQEKNSLTILHVIDYNTL